MAMMLVSTVVSASKVQVFFNQFQLDSYQDPYRGITRRGQDFEEVIISEINRAKKSVDLAVQELRLPNISLALAKAKKRKVKVRVILENDYHNTIKELNTSQEGDDHDAIRYVDLFALVDLNRDGTLQASEMNQRDAIHILRKNKITIKDDTSGYTNGSGLMHHKFLIIDNKKVIVSSANLTMSGVHGDVLRSESVGNANALMVVENTELSKVFTREFDIMWGKSGRSLFGLAKPFRKRKEIKIGQSTVTVQFSPTAGSRPWRESVNGLIASELRKARYEAFMGLFVFSEQRFANILFERMTYNPNFNLGILVERKFATRSYSELLDIWGLEILNDNCEYEAYNQPWDKPYMNVGTAIMNSSDVLHHKFAVVDERVVLFGSQNWSDSANRSNDETLLVIEDRDVAAAFRNEYLRMAKSSRMGPPKSLHKRIARMQEICDVDYTDLGF
jgi:phosphatidylserine/phosphatidylglycerophosphate/cardiolipin synthase-like enzyme